MQTGEVAGTPAYMAPEQANGRTATAAADVFAWAATITFAATGRPPFSASSLRSLLNHIVEGDPDLGGLSGPLRDRVDECLAKDPADRPSADALLLGLLSQGSRTEFVEDPAGLMEKGSQVAAPTMPMASSVGQQRQSSVRRSRKHPLRWAIGLLTAAGVSVLLIARGESEQPGIVIPADMAGHGLVGSTISVSPAPTTTGTG